MYDTMMGGSTDDYQFLLHTNQLIFRYFLKQLVHLESGLFLDNKFRDAKP